MPQKPPNLDIFGNPVGEKPPNLDQYGTPIGPFNPGEDFGFLEDVRQAIPQGVRDVWNKANEPLWEGPSRAARWLTEDWVDEKHPKPVNPLDPFSWMPVAGEKVVNTLGDFASGLTSPMGMADIASFGAGAAARRIGLPLAAKGLHMAGRAMATPYMGTGAYKIAEGDTLEEKLFGALEAGAGAWGAFSSGKPHAKAADVPPGAIPPSEGGLTITNLGEGRPNETRMRMRSPEDLTAGPKYLDDFGDVAAGTSPRRPPPGNVLDVPIVRPKLPLGDELDLRPVGETVPGPKELGEDIFKDTPRAFFDEEDIVPEPTPQPRVEEAPPRVEENLPDEVEFSDSTKENLAKLRSQGYRPTGERGPNGFPLLRRKAATPPVVQEPAAPPVTTGLAEGASPEIQGEMGAMRSRELLRKSGLDPRKGPLAQQTAIAHNPEEFENLRRLGFTAIEQVGNGDVIMQHGSQVKKGTPPVPPAATTPTGPAVTAVARTQPSKTVTAQLVEGGAPRTVSERIAAGEKVVDRTNIDNNGNIWVHNLDGNTRSGYADPKTAWFIEDSARMQDEARVRRNDPEIQAREKAEKERSDQLHRNLDIEKMMRDRYEGDYSGVPPARYRKEFNELYREKFGEEPPQGELTRTKVELRGELKGAKPRFNIGKDSYTPIFEDDIDKALFIIAQKKPSKRDADYLKFVMDFFQVDEATARQMGRAVSAQIKATVKGEAPGEVKISSLDMPGKGDIEPSQSARPDHTYDESDPFTLKLMDEARTLGLDPYKIDPAKLHFAVFRAKQTAPTTPRRTTERPVTPVTPVVSTGGPREFEIPGPAATGPGDVAGVRQGVDTAIAEDVARVRREAENLERSLAPDTAYRSLLPPEMREPLGWGETWRQRVTTYINNPNFSRGRPDIEPSEARIRRHEFIEPEEVAKRLKEGLPTAKAKDRSDTRFILTDGTRLTHNFGIHAEAAESVGLHLNDVIEAGVIRVTRDLSGAEVWKKITSAQAEELEDLMFYTGRSLNLDINTGGESLLMQVVHPGDKANKIYNIINNKFDIEPSEARVMDFGRKKPTFDTDFAGETQIRPDKFGPQPEVQPRDKWDQPVPGERGELQGFAIPHDPRSMKPTEVGQVVSEMLPTGHPDLDAKIRRMKQIVNEPVLSSQMLQEFREIAHDVSMDKRMPESWKYKWNRLSSAQPGEEVGKWTHSPESDRQAAIYDEIIRKSKEDIEPSEARILDFKGEKEPFELGDTPIRPKPLSDSEQMIKDTGGLIDAIMSGELMNYKGRKDTVIDFNAEGQKRIIMKGDENAPSFDFEGSPTALLRDMGIDPSEVSRRTSAEVGKPETTAPLLREVGEPGGYGIVRTKNVDEARDIYFDYWYNAEKARQADLPRVESVLRILMTDAEEQLSKMPLEPQGGKKWRISGAADGSKLVEHPEGRQWNLNGSFQEILEKYRIHPVDVDFNPAKYYVKAKGKEGLLQKFALVNENTGRERSFDYGPWNAGHKKEAWDAARKYNIDPRDVVFEEPPASVTRSITSMVDEMVESIPPDGTIKPHGRTSIFDLENALDDKISGETNLTVARDNLTDLNKALENPNLTPGQREHIEFHRAVAEDTLDRLIEPSDARSIDLEQFNKDLNQIRDRTNRNPDWVMLQGMAREVGVDPLKYDSVNELLNAIDARNAEIQRRTGKNTLDTSDYESSNARRGSATRSEFDRIARRDELQKGWDSLEPQQGNDFVVHDAHGVYSPEELASFNNAPVVKEVHQVIKNLIDELEAAFVGFTEGRVQKTVKSGFLIDDIGSAGVNVIDLSNPDNTAVLVNLFDSFKRENTIREIADRFISAVEHEWTHNLAREEGKGFTWAQLQVKERYGLENLNNAARKLQAILERPENARGLSEILQGYTNSRGRRPTKTNPFIRQGSSAASIPEGPGGNVGGNRTGGKGTIGDEEFKRLWDEVDAEASAEPPVDVDAIRKDLPQVEMPGLINEMNKQADIAKMTRDPIERESIIRQALDLNRTVITAYDLSAPLRQGLPLITRKEFWTSLNSMFKAWGSEVGYESVMRSIDNHPSGYFKKQPTKNPLVEGPSFAEQSGLDLTDAISRREEAFRSVLADKIPGVRKSNRAFTAYLNKLRSDTFVSMMDAVKAEGRNPMADRTIAENISTFINNATGRGSLTINIPKVPLPGTGRNLITGREINLATHAKTLTDVFFAPQLASSRIRMYTQVLNPKLYTTMDPVVRRATLKSLFTMAGTGLAIGEMARLGGAEVSNDPRSSDFRKIKIGDTRIDMFGGHQQYLVAAARMLTGQYTSSIDPSSVTDLSEGGFGMQTRASVMSQFAANKLAPLPSLALSWMTGREFDGMPFDAKVALAHRIAPIIFQDLKDLYDEDPSMVPYIAAPFFGAGIQTYGR